METPQTPGRIARFGPFEVNLRSGELRKRGIRLPLQEQPLRILTALLDRPGEIVSRQELCDLLWPGGTFVDFEHSLNAAVRRLRLTLGDEADVPRFIETVHRRGYRFLALNSLFNDPQRAPFGAVRSVHMPNPGERVRARLAVMPFSPEDVFSDGLTDEVITQLTRTCPAHIGIVAKNSVARVAADYLIEGAVRREGDRLRIRAHLIESCEQTLLWAAGFDRLWSDALTLQMDLAQTITRAIVESLSVDSVRAVS
jgi:DNA-binding winged helix-turn-helix (wHTH) protein